LPVTAWRAAFHPVGHILALGIETGEIHLLDAANGNLLHTLSGHRDSVTSLAFSPDGLWLASGSRDAAIILWGQAENLARISWAAASSPGDR